MKTVIIDHVIDTQFELQYKVVAKFKSSCFLSVYRQLHVNCVMAAKFTGK